MAKQVYLDPVSGEPQNPAAAPPESSAEAPAPAPSPAPLDFTQPPAPGQNTTQPVTPPNIPAPVRLVDPGSGPVAAPASGSLDPGSVIADWMAHNNPQGHTDASYWLGRIAATGGLNAGNLAYWQGRFTEAPGTHVEGGAAPTGGGAQTAAGLDPSISAFYNAQTAALAQQQQRDDEIRAIIRSRLAAAGGPVDETSAEVAQPLSAARDEAARSQATEQTQLAERLYAQGGLNTGALGQALQQSNERNAGGLSNLRAGLITHVADAKRAELQNLLQLATAQGDSASAREISAQIAAINASVTSSGQGISLAEFLASLNQNTALAGAGTGG